VTDYLELDGEPVDRIDPGLLRATSYGHFTSMQVRGGRVRGLPFHVERLDRSSVELFGRGVPAERWRSYVRSALERAGVADASVRITAFTRGGRAPRDHDASPPGGTRRHRHPSETRPVPLDELADFDAAYLTNSIDPALPIAAITTPTGTTSYQPDPTSTAQIEKAYEAMPPEAI
jgi:branched-subunit amino acid aminotransferase/4-amino-4-deoxychorismate lyase